MSIPFSLIVAVDEDHGIGLDGAMPWSMPADLAHFKEVTMGRPIIMGRKTFDAIGRVLPGRRNIIVTRDPAWYHPAVSIGNSLDQALDIASEHGEEAFVIGGGQLYAEALPRAERVYLTRIHARFGCDTFFPKLDPKEWLETEREVHEPDLRNHYDYSFHTYERR
jgi:dihydrofolate reductase